MKKSTIVVALFLIVCLLQSFSNHKWKRSEVLHFDVSGYYLYLPAIFIYKDLGTLKFYSYLDSVYRPANEYKNYGLYPQEGDKKLNKYTLGVAIGELPFFLIAHLYTMFLQNTFNADGYSEPYQFSVAMSSIMWSVIGLFVLAALIRKRFNDNIAATTIFILGFGTNLYCYTWLDSGMSHGLAFMLFACVLYFSERWYTTYKAKHALFLGLFLGWVIITRPVDIAIVFLPLLWPIIVDKNYAQSRLQLWRQYKSQILFCIIVMTSVVFLQVGYWKYITGEFIHFAYEEEGFNFSNPHIVDGLFSFRKGWFVYTPIAFISFFGLWLLFIRNKALAIATILFFCTSIYITFSWHDWQYGWGFGARGLVETYAVLSIPLSTLLYWLSKRRVIVKSFAMAVFGFFVFFNIFQTDQYANGTIKGDSMNKQYYWRIYNKRYPSEEDLKYLKN